jgi:hypothetical protein
MAREIERALAALRRRRDRAARATPLADAPVPLRGAAFRASVDERLRTLERQLDEVKGRVNGLLFLLAGAVATQVVLRLFI